MDDTFDRACRRAGELSPRARRASPFTCESLESRRLLSSFVYSDLAALVDRPDASSLGDGFAGPVVAVGDIDGDGATDLLVGNAYFSVQFGSGAIFRASGAAVLSGATGRAIRTHTPIDSLRFGWSVAALGDINTDGIPDYGIGTGGPEGDPVAYAYSGATGEILHTFGVHHPSIGGAGIGGNVIAGAGDVNGDGRPDILVSFIEDNRTVLYSGVDGAQIREFDGERAFALAGSEDLDGDGTPDFVSGTLRYLSAYSGASGARLWRIDQPAPYSLPSVTIDISTDFNADGRADLLVTTNDSFSEGGFGRVRLRARVYSGVDGAQLLLVPGPADRGLAGAAAFIQDQNGDGVPDIAATVNGTGQFGTGADNGVHVYSGADASLLSTMGDDGPATLTEPDPLLGVRRRMAIKGPTTAIDLDGDGHNELITAAVLDAAGAAQIPLTLRLIAFNGETLGNPVFDGADADASGKLVAWGHLGAAGFVYNRGRTTFITDLGFHINDRIVSFTGFGSEVLLVVEADADPTNPIAWYASDELTGGRAYTIADAPPTGGPIGAYRMVRVVDAEGGKVLVQINRDGTRPTVCIFERTPEGGPADVGRLAYRFDGQAIAMRADQVVGLKYDDPFVGVLWNLGETIYIPGLRPVDVYLSSPTTAGTPAVVVGIAERNGDEFPRPYTYTSSTGEFTALPLIDGGSDWNPIAANSAGDVVGTFKRSTGETSIFITRYVYSGDPAVQTSDVLGSTLIGAPAALTGAVPTIIGLGLSAGGAGPYDIYFRYDDPATGAGRSAVLSDLSGPGPYHSPADAAFAISQDGDVLVMRSTAGEILVYTRRLTLDGDAVWSRGDLAFSPGGIHGPPLYVTPHFGPIITWTIAGYTSPFIALAADDGVILIEPVLEPSGGSGIPPAPPVERYHVRNLTTEIAGSEPIAASLITFLPLNDLRLIAGLAADGDLVMYGLTSPIARTSGVESSWAYANLYDQVLRPAGAPEPHFNPDASGDLIGYVTAWGGLNIAGVDSGSGDVVVFWTAPGLAGWQVANLDDALVDHTGPTGVSHLSVYLTSWGGINIVGGSKLGVYWWAPGLGGSWKFNRLTDIAAGATLRPETITSYVTPWDGLNIAGLDSTGRLWVYWWTPTVYWTAETIDDALPEADAALERAGRLRSSDSDSGRIDIYARSLFGDPLQYEWSPSSPWALTNLNVVADRP